MGILQLARWDVERVALARVAAIEATAEPGHTLGAGAVRELALVALTKRIVANLVRGVQRFAEVRFVNRQIGARRVAPYAGKAIGLQFDAHRRLVLALALNLDLGRADQILHMVTDFVRDHIGLGKVPRCSQLMCQLIEERQVEINPAVVGAVKRTDR